MATCIVSFVDLDGIRHSVEVEAESLYESAALAIRVLRQHNCLPGLVTYRGVERGADGAQALSARSRSDYQRGAAPRASMAFPNNSASSLGVRSGNLYPQTISPVPNHLP